ncbi:SLATT domain-containing protein [Psychrobacter sp. 16-Bac2893]|tara:strand:+ start:479 stop:1129 length:651 start_codon:yes stop_codon:yes gene_type:complete
MTKEQLLHEIANIGYSTSYGRDKSYSTADISEKTSSRIGIILAIAAISSAFYPFVNNIAVIAFTLASIAYVPLYLRQYQDKKYIQSAQNLEQLELKLKDLYYKVKLSEDDDLSNFINELRTLDLEQKNQAISTQVFGSDWYAHLKIFWTKKVNSQWFVNELGLKLFFDKLPFSFFLCCIIFILIVFLSITAYFIANLLVANGQATSILALLRGICT